MNNNYTSGMMELLTTHCIEFNDRVIVVEETERGIKLRAIGRGFKADYDHLGINGFVTHLFQVDSEVRIRRSSLKSLIVNIESTLMS